MKKAVSCFRFFIFGFFLLPKQRVFANARIAADSQSGVDVAVGN